MKRRTFLSTAAALPLAAQAADSQPLYLLTYDHGGLTLWGIPQLLNSLRTATAWLDKYPGFKIGIENEARTYDYLAEHEPKILDELRGYLAKYKGRFGIGTCTYGQPLTTFINDESNIRQIYYARETNRRLLGTTPDIWLMSEHAQHSQTPQILAGFGFKGAFMRTHYMMYGYNPQFDTACGWWTGPDGSRIAAIPTYKGEGEGFGKQTLDNMILTRCPGPDCHDHSLEEFRAKFPGIQPLIATRADDAPLRREDLVKQTEGDARYRWILLEDLAAKFPQPTATFATKPDDFHVRMPWGYCGNEIWNACRRAEVAVLTAERMAAIELMLGGADHEPALDSSWKNLLSAQHHDVQIVGLVPEARKYTSASISQAKDVQQSSMSYIATRMKSDGPLQATVFNPSSWQRKEWIELDVETPGKWPLDIQVRHNGEVVPAYVSEVVQTSGGDGVRQVKLAMLADPPPLGFASYSIAPGRPSPPPVLGWPVAFHPEGGLQMGIGKRTCFFAGKINNVDCESKGAWKMLSPTHAREHGVIGGIDYRLDLKITPGSPRLDFKVRFDFEGQNIGAVSEDKRDAHSPFVHEDKLRFKIYPATGPATRDLPFIIAETEDKYVQGNYWTAAGNLAFLNRGTMGSVREADGAFSNILAYSMYYVWGTRMLNGPYEYEFAVMPFGPDTHRHALEYNFPLIAEVTSPGDGSLGERAQPCTIDTEEVIATALYPRNRKVELRLHEFKGHAANPKLPAHEAEIDLEGRTFTGSPASFRPWQFRTFRLAGKPS